MKRIERLPGESDDALLERTAVAFCDQYRANVPPEVYYRAVADLIADSRRVLEAARRAPA